MGQIWELFSSNLNKYVAPEYLSIDKTQYPMRHQTAFCWYNLKKPHWYGLLWKSLNDARFTYTYKSVPYAAKQVKDGPHYIAATIDYVKYLVQDMGKQQSIKGRMVSTDHLCASIESAN